MQNPSCVIIGAGHNGLVAACYLAKANFEVTLIEKNSVYGGAAVSAQTFSGVEAKLSRYSYLVALMPEQIINELNLNIDLLSRSISSFTPTTDNKGLLIERQLNDLTRQSFSELTGSDRDFNNWINFYSRVEKIAAILAPTLLTPLASKQQIKSLIDQIDENAWRDFFEQPIGKTIDESFESDLVKGIVLTDALIGTYSDGFDKALLANRCFLYHLIGNGTGEWKVPKGGMGAITDELYQTALGLGVKVLLDAEVSAIELSANGVEVVYGNKQRLVSDFAISNIAPSKLAKLRGENYQNPQPDGSQVKMNLLLKKLPTLKSGHNAAEAFAGTFHIDESLSDLKTAFAAVNRGEIPEVLPAEIYCHTLTDSSILSTQLAASGYHTITLFGLLMKASLFDQDHDQKRELVKSKYLQGLNKYLVEDIFECLATDDRGEYCIEVKTPQDIEESIGLPRGHIFHEDLQWPFAETDDEVGKWGTETNHHRLFNCSSAAKRGGGVSGIVGRNAAYALIQSFQMQKGSENK
jgi:phytoene dehydrogenase-like protein